MFDLLTYNQKRLLGLIALLGATVGIGILLLWMFLRVPMIEEEIVEVPAEVPEGVLTGAQEAGEFEFTPEEEDIGLPTSIAEGAETFTQQLTSTAVISPTMIDGSGIAFYNPTDGRFYKMDESGELIAMSLTQFPNAETVVFADTADIVAIEFPDGSNILYDFATQEQTTLPSHWEDFDFSADGEEVVSKSISSDPAQNSLVITSSDGSQTQVIAPIGSNADKVTVNWSTNNNVVGFSETGSSNLGFGRYEIYIIGNDGEESGNLIVEGGNFSAIWSPTSSKILYSTAWTANDERPSLWIVNGTGDIGSDRESLGVETWVEKCTFKNDSTVICAVPNEITNGSGLDHRLNDSNDSLYEVNTNTGSKKLLGYPVLDLEMFNLFVSDDDAILYFTDQYSRLNYMRLE
ncbi:hypothetical protein HN358_02280 [Candidatus Uhrbacteria bacterium]|jgi:hypothetical protein|nr:hypothetical protein [Candidatus Uhrbacteria bacterium]MBT7717506.1 hypothetical protein [Candidatus Uhrbacteria bacterium]